MFCQNCGNEINEGIKFCPNCGNAIETIKNTANKNTVEIQGDFPVAQSKIPLELLEGEKLILQYNVAVISKLAANGILSLTNKRILIKKDSFGKASLKSAGLLTGALMSSVKVVPEIKLSDSSYNTSSYYQRTKKRSRDYDKRRLYPQNYFSEYENRQ